MANYFVLNTKFQPYTFDEMIKPFQMYGEAYKEQENALDALQTDAEAMSSLMKDSQSYQNFLNATRAISEGMAQNGIDANTKRQIRNLTKTYAPIKAGADAYKAMKEYREKIQSAHPKERVLFTKDYTPEELIGGITPDNSFINLDQAKADVLAESAQFAEGLNAIQGIDNYGNIITNPSTQYRVSPDNKFIEIIEGSGVDNSYLANTFKNIDNGVLTDTNNPLIEIYNRLWKANSGDSLSPDKQLQLKESLKAGLVGAIASKKSSIQRNPNYESTAEIRAREQAMGNLPIGQDKDGNLIYSNPLGQYWIRSPKGELINYSNINNSPLSSSTQDPILERDKRKIEREQLDQFKLNLKIKNDNPRRHLGTQWMDSDISIDEEDLVKLDLFDKDQLFDNNIFAFKDNDGTFTSTQKEARLNSFINKLLKSESLPIGIREQLNNTQSYDTKKDIIDKYFDIYVDKNFAKRDSYIVVGKGVPVTKDEREKFLAAKPDNRKSLYTNGYGNELSEQERQDALAIEAYQADQKRLTKRLNKSR